MMVPPRKRLLRVGVVDHGLEGNPGFPASELGFSVRWRATPDGALRAIRRDSVAGVVLQSSFDGADAVMQTATKIHQREPRLKIWLALSSARVVMLAVVVGGVQLVDASDKRIALLTLRELDVLAAIRTGSTNRGIATTLGISVSTVNRHVEHILAKLGAHNRAQAGALLRMPASRNV
jgi:DNA-binding CsgD family transcriptional regulator